MNFVAVVCATRQRRDGCIRCVVGDERSAGGLRLARRHQQHREPAGARQAIQRGCLARDDGTTMCPSVLPEIYAAALAGLGSIGIAERKTVFISARTWIERKSGWMDYDGANQHRGHTPRQHFPFAARLADNSRVAFATLGREGWSVRMYSLNSGRLVAFPAGTAGGPTNSPGLVADASEDCRSQVLAWSGDPEVWGGRRQRFSPKRITYIQRDRRFPRVESATHRSIAWVSGRTGLPQIYTMDQMGANIQRNDRRRLCGFAIVSLQADSS